MNTESNNVCGKTSHEFHAGKHHSSHCGWCACLENSPCHQNHKKRVKIDGARVFRENLKNHPPTSHPQWEERFDKLFANAGGDYDGSCDPIKQFIHSLLREEKMQNRKSMNTDEYLMAMKDGAGEVRARVVKILESKKIKNPTLNFEFSHNAALTDAINHITKENE